MRKRLDLKSSLQKNYHKIILALILILLVSVNFQVGHFIIGFDNISPYFGLQPVLDKIFDANGRFFISNAPLILITLFFSLLKAIQIPEWLINNIYIFGCLSFGIFGAANLAQFAFKDKFKDRGERSIYIFGGLFYLCNLVMLWIFNQPNFYFIAAFASIPWCIYLLTRTVNKERFSIIDCIVTIITFILFTQTALNLVAFASYLGAIIILTAILIPQTKSTQKELSRKVIKLLVIAFAYLAVLSTLGQLSLMIRSDTNLLNVFQNHFSELRNNPFTGMITESIGSSREYRGDLINTIRYSGTWIEFRNLDGGVLFANYSFYNNLLIYFIGIASFILALSTPISFYKKHSNSSVNRSDLHLKRVLTLSFLLIIGVFLNSKYLELLFGGNEILIDAFRWNSSKLWPLQLIPQVLLLSYVVTHLTFNLKSLSFKVALALIIILNLFYIYPAFKGELTAQEFKVDIPISYEDLAQQINSQYSNKKIYLLPAPEQLYFNQTSWGYFGSDFLSFMVNGNGYETGLSPFFYESNKYNQLESDLRNCTISSSLKFNEIVIYDETLSTSSKNREAIEICLHSGKLNSTKVHRFHIISPQL